jgi:predicted DNA-binding protein (MmcQ/YjbR family)
MNLEALRKFCGGLPGATRDIKWGADEVYSVGAKMFAVFWIDKKKAKTVSFKAGADRFLEPTDLSGIVPAPYLARAHWVQVQDAKALSDADACALVTHSHALVAAKLPKKIRAALADASHGKPAVRSKR